MAKQEIDVSVIMPTYNRGEKIIESIKAIERNNLENNKIEIVIIDDASEKDSFKFIKHVMKKYKNIIYLKNEKNMGPAASRNRGIKIARGNFIFFTDDDCIVPKDWIKSYLDFFKIHKDVALVGGCAKPGSDNIFAKIENLKDKILKIRVKEPMIGRGEVPTGFTGNSAYRKKIFKEIGFFNEKIKIAAGEDVDLKNRVAERYNVASLPLLVIHNHTYTFEYFLARLIKEGLERKPEGRIARKMLLLISNFPFLVYNIIRKTKKYRELY